MSSQSKDQAVIESFIRKTIERISKESVGLLMSDLFIQTDIETAEILLFDDNKTLLGKTVIFNWLSLTSDKEAFDALSATTIKDALTVLNAQDFFDNEIFIKPFSVSLTDENFSVIDELLFVDEDILRLDDPLLKDLDKDLNDFLSELFSDM